MIVDVALYAIALLSAVVGYKAGLLKTIFRALGYVGGAIAGLYLAFTYATKLDNIWLAIGTFLVSIFICAQIGRFIGERLSAALRATIVRGPLRWIDSVAGAALELVRVAVIAYLALSLLMFSPWTIVKDAIGSSNVYEQMQVRFPHVVTELRAEIEKRISLNPRLYVPEDPQLSAS